MPTLTVIYDPQDRVAFNRPPGNPKAFDDIKFASMRVDVMDDLDVALITQDLTKALVAQLKKDLPMAKIGPAGPGYDKPAKKNWIAGAVKNKGGLHRSLGVPAGEKIPAAKVEAATHSDDPKTRKEANLAETLEGLR